MEATNRPGPKPGRLAVSDACVTLGVVLLDPGLDVGLAVADAAAELERLRPLPGVPKPAQRSDRQVGHLRHLLSREDLVHNNPPFGRFGGPWASALRITVQADER